DSFRKSQRQRLRKMAGDWLINRPNRPHSDLIRFDAIGVTIDATGKLVSIDHLEGAF
ncbi:MAG: putative endonuclease, partial [Solirubrobacteraceae bacterium]|nr:putative endonuclease [Solirubrobacteraceae bacterium]